jgi:hypothetical protein
MMSSVCMDNRSEGGERPMRRIPMLLMMPIATLALLAAALPAYPADVDVATHIFSQSPK